jgi:integrase
MDEPDRWRVDFYDFTVPPPETDDPDIARYGDVHRRAARNAARHGTPILTPPSGRPDARINLFFRTGKMAVSGMLTWRRYAYTLAVWLDFLDAVGRTWDEATAGDVEAFKDWRLTDLRNEERIRATSFDTDRAGLNSFYTWASARYGIRNPVPTVPTGTRAAGAPSESGYRRRRDPLRPAASSRRQVKWLLRPALTQWRDVGLRGYGFDGLRRSGWRGFNEDRDVAFVDGLYGTGLRLREWSSVLDVEFPRSQGRRLHRAWLAEQCIKGAKEGPITGFLGAPCSRWRRTWIRSRDPVRRLSLGLSAGAFTSGCAAFGSWWAITPALARSTSRGAMVRYRSRWMCWVPTRGSGCFAGLRRGWNHFGFGCRSAVCQKGPTAGRTPSLRWFSLLSLVEEKRVEGLSEREAADLREQLGDLWLQLAVLMGHKHPDTTREHYLNPRELHQTGEKSQVGRSPKGHGGRPETWTAAS